MERISFLDSFVKPKNRKMLERDEKENRDKKCFITIFLISNFCILEMV